MKGEDDACASRSAAAPGQGESMMVEVFVHGAAAVASGVILRGLVPRISRPSSPALTAPAVRACRLQTGGHAMTDRDIRHALPPRPLRRLLSVAAVAPGLAPGAALAETPRSVAPQAAPQAWRDYAAVVSEQVQARLAGDDPAAQRLRDYLNQLPGAATSSGVTLKIAFWIDADGMVTRVDFPVFVHPEPNDDLKALLVGVRLPEAPPKDMVLPLRLTVQLRPKDRTESPAWNGRWTKAAATVRVSYGLDGRVPAGEGAVSSLP